MKLYHGSNLTVSQPIILESNRALDFGKGFYLTTDLDQAIKWSKTTTKRKNSGIPTVSIFEYDESDNLKILKFENANIKWLKFVSKNRKMESIDESYDIIIGPVANDNTMPVINSYLDGTYDEEEAIERLLTQKLTDQFVFKTDLALKSLHFLEAKNYE